jgi:branched-chain amino acid transport system substrate-binding protein
MKSTDQLKNSFIHHWRFILVEVLLIVTAISSFVMLNSESNTVSIAVIAPLSGKNVQRGKDIVIALNIYATQINKYGGIKGRKLKILAYDDQGEPQHAKKIAQTIANNNQVVAVLGHFLDNTTQATSFIYHKAKIPIISPHSNIKTSNEWAFQILPDPQDYGEYSAHYIRQVLHKKTVTIIYSATKTVKEDLNINAAIMSFANTFRDLGGNINLQGLVVDSIQIQSIITQLQQKTDNKDHILVLALKEKNIVPVIVALKRHNIHLPIVTIDNDLDQKFNAYLEEQQDPGYFSNGIYTPSILLLDSINRPNLALVKKEYNLKYQDEISSTAMNAVLAASFIVESLGNNAAIETDDLPAIRQNLKNNLKQNNWFDKNQIGLASQLFIGVFKQQHLISAPLNPTRIVLGDVDNLDDNTHQEKLLKNINGYTLYLTDFVYTGIAMNKISEIDFDNLTYNLDFFLWFRYQDEVKNADDIEFLNMVKFQFLKKPTKGISVKLVKDYSINGETYKRYHVKGRFKTDMKQNYALGKQDIFVKFRHREENLFKLNYVSDFINSNKGIFNLEHNKLNPNIIDDSRLVLYDSFSYLGISHKTILGSPEELNQSDKFSQFISKYQIKSTIWSFRGIATQFNTKFSGREDAIDMALTFLLLSMSCSLFIFTVYAQREQVFEKTSNYWWLLQLPIILFILLFAELVFSQGLYNLKYAADTRFNIEEIDALMLYMRYGIAFLWWLIPAYYITSAFDQFLWRPIEKQTGTDVPSILRLFVTLIIYALALLGILSFVIEITFASLAATSGVLALFFAIASKVDLSNIIAGLGISLSKPFHLGDWVKIKNIEGQVIEMTPRTLKLLTANLSMISIPNTTVSSTTIENYARPNAYYRLQLGLKIVPVYRFEQVETVLLTAINSIKGVMKIPKASIGFEGQGNYQVKFYIDDYAQRDAISQAAWRHIWQQLEQADITLW